MLTFAMRFGFEGRESAEEKLSRALYSERGCFLHDDRFEALQQSVYGYHQ